VYFHFGTSARLQQAVDVAAVGDDEPVAMLKRPWLEEARAERDPKRVIALSIAYRREIVTRVGPIMRVVRDAAAVDPDMAASGRRTRPRPRRHSASWPSSSTPCRRRTAWRLLRGHRRLAAADRGGPGPQPGR
jgi:hypothetical protein